YAWSLDWQKRTPLLAPERGGADMLEVELSAGTIEYEDTGGDGPALIFLHGVAMDGSLWRSVVADLRSDHRCVVPALPLGGHRRPMKPYADLSIRAIVRLVAEFLGKLNLRGVTLVGNDWGGAQLLVSERLDERVGRLVLASCEAFENYPPGIPGRALAQAASIPGGLYVAFQAMRLRLLRRLPLTWGWMSKRSVPDGVMDGWFRPLQTQSKIRRDLRKYARSIPSKKVLLEWSERLRSFDRPALVVWAAEDRVMPPEHGRRLAELFPHGRLVEIPDSYTLIPEDQPGELAHAIREFVRDTP
ncbi:MAG TPA: alpha/beta hydrolase, partial [Longimicrobiaceae bacterium]